MACLPGQVALDCTLLRNTACTSKVKGKSDLGYITCSGAALCEALSAADCRDGLGYAMPLAIIDIAVIAVKTTDAIIASTLSILDVWALFEVPT